MYTKKILLIFLLVLVLSGCSRNNKFRTIESNEFVEDDHNPFDFSDKDNDENLSTDTLGTLSHGITNFQYSESNEKIITYQGGELQIDYWIYAEGIAKDLGFLIYIEGVPQPYKVKSVKEDYQYLHVLELEEGKDVEFSFLFNPVTGKKGDELIISIVSVIDPLFKPDMIKTTSYGYTQGILESFYSMVYKQNADDGLLLDVVKKKALNNENISNTAMDDEDKENFQTGFKTGTSLSDKQVYSILYIDNKDMRLESSYDVKDKSKLNVRFEMTGFPGIRYRNTLYFNNEPICNVDNECFDFDLQKGYKAVFNGEIDIEKLGEKGTFYIVSVPLNKDDFPDDVIMVLKTKSLLIYNSSDIDQNSEEDSLDTISEGNNFINGKEGLIYSQIANKIEEIYYAGEEELCIISDEIHFYNIMEERIITSIERNSKSSYLDARKIDSGYVIIGETGEKYEESVYNFETGKRETLESYNLSCIFYNDDMLEMDTVDIVKDVGIDLVYHPSQISVSEDGKIIAVLDENSLYIYNRLKKEKKLIVDSLLVNDIIITNISFVDNEKIVFIGMSFNENKQMYPAYGMINADGSDFVLHAGESFGKLTSYDEFSILSQRESLEDLLGEAWLYKHKEDKIKKIKLREIEESENVWGSNLGKHFATSVRIKGKGWSIRIYDVVSGKCIYEKLYKDNNVDKFKDPYIYILDQGNDIILLFRSSDDKLKNKVLVEVF